MWPICRIQKKRTMDVEVVFYKHSGCNVFIYLCCSSYRRPFIKKTKKYISPTYNLPCMKSTLLNTDYNIYLPMDNLDLFFFCHFFCVESKMYLTVVKPSTLLITIFVCTWFADFAFTGKKNISTSFTECDFESCHVYTAESADKHFFHKNFCSASYYFLQKSCRCYHL